MQSGTLKKKQLILISNKNDNDSQHLIQDIHNSNVYEIVWYINSKKTKSQLEYIKTKKELHTLLKQKKCDEILYIDSDLSKEELLEIWELSRVYDIRYRYLTNSFDITKANTTLSLINQIPVVEIKNSSLWAWGRVWKRIFDFLWSICIIIIGLPIWILIAIAIKIEDPKWPILYKNKRVWKHGNIFSLYKFRYMKWEDCVKEAYGIDERKDTALKYEKELIEKKSTRKGPLYKIKDDPRKTKIGSFIEKYSLDEIPQCINVLLWEMSLVWPRPHQPREVKNYSLRQKRLLTIRPWITWMAQVNGRENNSFEQEAELDFFYIENWSFLLDSKILFKTIWVILSRKSD